ncbi:hypothetical protein D5R81_15150 [Parashewanella spongiae]|uniref:Uncharacterized protein n=1 Tax=Parashewanella spongiae TaxID=342950 RepID=A0A3A6TJR0_9GAMM|nr:hypothetical protein [Parashewanella spongiae]MCL1078759.1 hypothetical protein [Parashewanella spongiae]RJY07776.1 hypothetical protein D5R81_15150 [Parashewanella spongiae]
MMQAVYSQAQTNWLTDYYSDSNGFESMIYAPSQPLSEEVNIEHRIMQLAFAKLANGYRETEDIGVLRQDVSSLLLEQMNSGLFRDAITENISEIEDGLASLGRGKKNKCNVDAICQLSESLRKIGFIVDDELVNDRRRGLSYRYFLKAIPEFNAAEHIVEVPQKPVESTVAKVLSSGHFHQVPSVIDKPKQCPESGLPLVLPDVSASRDCQILTTMAARHRSRRYLNGLLKEATPTEQQSKLEQAIDKLYFGQGKKVELNACAEINVLIRGRGYALGFNFVTKHPLEVERPLKPSAQFKHLPKLPTDHKLEDTQPKYSYQYQLILSRKGGWNKALFHFISEEPLITAPCKEVFSSTKRKANKVPMAQPCSAISPDKKQASKKSEIQGQKERLGGKRAFVSTSVESSEVKKLKVIDVNLTDKVPNPSMQAQMLAAMPEFDVGKLERETGHSYEQLKTLIGSVNHEMSAAETREHMKKLEALSQTLLANNAALSESHLSLTSCDKPVATVHPQPPLLKQQSVYSVVDAMQVAAPSKTAAVPTTPPQIKVTMIQALVYDLEKDKINLFKLFGLMSKGLIGRQLDQQNLSQLLDYLARFIEKVREQILIISQITHRSYKDIVRPAAAKVVRPNDLWGQKPCYEQELAMLPDQLQGLFNRFRNQVDRIEYNLALLPSRVDIVQQQDLNKQLAINHAWLTETVNELATFQQNLLAMVSKTAH